MINDFQMSKVNRHIFNILLLIVLNNRVIFRFVLLEYGRMIRHDCVGLGHVVH